MTKHMFVNLSAVLRLTTGFWREMVGLYSFVLL